MRYFNQVVNNTRYFKGGVVDADLAPRSVVKIVEVTGQTYPTMPSVANWGYFGVDVDELLYKVL